jgi:hypothetical protein
MAFPQVYEQPAEALALEHDRSDLAALVRGPQLAVDLPVGGEDGRRIRQVEAAQSTAQRDPLGAVRVEERMVEVEKDGASRRQGGLLCAVRDQAALQVVGGDAYGHAVAGDHADAILPHLPVQPGEDLVVLAAFHLVVAAGQYFNDDTL